MKKISPDHKWYRDHPNQKPLIHIAPDLGEMEPLCHLFGGAIKIEKWKTVHDDPTCQKCIAILKRKVIDQEINLKCQELLDDLVKFIEKNSKQNAEDKLIRIMENLPKMYESINKK